ncbi:branched-chain-amino-acid transaminase [Methanoregula sp.]|uniref:branched-chain-amino-acid transaminase n=1 Tax=Methanoregula sp. TaxID=2052170 RepID=UPI00262A27E6|nr:branched-chain-amino-acid transaminase [Methanoregula sp.]MDD5143720.1 branched-chain-amino-acid transaminase [Methanoregula sp.]
MIIYYDGKFLTEDKASISVFDHGFLYGDGCFEGIRAYNGRIFRLKEHIDRLYDSAKTIDIKPPMTKEEMAEAICEVLRRNKLDNAYIRPIITRGKGDLGLDPRKCPKASVIIIAVTWGAMYGDLYEKGLKGVTVSVRRNPAECLPPNVKSLNYLNNILAKIEANYKGGDEAIFFDTNGYLSEGSGDNLYIVKNGEIITPPTLNNLRGVTRLVVLEIAKSLGITVREQNLGYFDLYTADELICSGTAAEVAPIVWVDGRTIGSGKPGPIFRQLAAAFGPITKKEGYPIHGKPKKAAAKAVAKTAVKKAVKKPVRKPVKKPVKAAAKPKSKAKKR